MGPSLIFREALGRAGTWRLIYAVGLEFFSAVSGRWPVGHAEYRTEVSVFLRLRKIVYGCGGPERFQFRFSYQLRQAAELLGRRWPVMSLSA